MSFSRLRGFKSICLRVALVLLVCVMATGCKENIPDDDEVFEDASKRVADNVLPEMTEEAEAVLRNLTNLLAALPQICATPLAKLGVPGSEDPTKFASVLPVGRSGSGATALGPPDSVVLIGEDEEDTDEDIFLNSWSLTWRNVILGDLRANPDKPSVDMTLNVRYRTSQLLTLTAVPFSLVPQSALLATTVDEPPSLEAGSTDPVSGRFFLYQDAQTGVWTLRWRAFGAARFFSGTISLTPFSRVIRRVSKASQDVVESLQQDDPSGPIEFAETTTTTEDKGFTFYARPGERIRFELRIGPDEDNNDPITSNQLRIGAGESLPAGEDPGDFRLATNLPIEPSATQPPVFGLDGKPRTFIWQDVENADNLCNPGTEDRWRIEFRTPGGQMATFTGEVTAFEDEEDTSVELTPFASGNCEDEREDDGRKLIYTCTLQGAQSAAYDICVTRGQRVLFDPSVDDLADPRLIFIGAERALPLTSDPFDIVFDVDVVEQQSDRNLTFTDTQIFLGGNNNAVGVVRLNPDQVSLEPLCGRLPAEIETIIRPGVAPDTELVQPRVRLNGSGDYATNRFDGSLYTLEEVEFLDEAVQTLDDARRFPDRGLITLVTRVEDEVENSSITARMDDIEHDSNSRVTQIPIDLDLSISDVIFEFDDQWVNLSLE